MKESEDIQLDDKKQEIILVEARKDTAGLKRILEKVQKAFDDGYRIKFGRGRQDNPMIGRMLRIPMELATGEGKKVKRLEISVEEEVKKDPLAILHDKKSTMEELSNLALDKNVILPEDLKNPAQLRKFLKDKLISD